MDKVEYGMKIEQLDRLCTAKSYGEAAKVAVRNIRRDGNDAFKKLKGSDISEDEIKDLETQLQKITDKYIAEVDKAVEVKSKEVLTV